MISFFNAEFQKKTGNKCITNRNKVKYLLADILRDIGVEELKSLIKYYVDTDKAPTLQKFCFEYDEILLHKRATEDDKKERISLLATTKKSVVEFRKRYEK